MSRSILGLGVLFLIAMPCAAVADVYPSLPVPLPASVTHQRLLPRQVFHWLDTNHDGLLTLREFLAAPWVQNKQQATRFFRWMDTNKDGLVSLQEFLDAYARYSASNGNSVRVAYPWAWTYWRPWQYGWYWHNNSWYRRPGVWSEYVTGPHRVVRHVGMAAHSHSVAKSSRPVKHSHSVAKSSRPVKHSHSVAKSSRPKHSGSHKGHNHHSHRR